MLLKNKFTTILVCDSWLWHFVTLFLTHILPTIFCNLSVRHIKNMALRYRCTILYLDLIGFKSTYIIVVIWLIDWFIDWRRPNRKRKCMCNRFQSLNWSWFNQSLGRVWWRTKKLEKSSDLWKFATTTKWIYLFRALVRGRWNKVRGMRYVQGTQPNCMDMRYAYISKTVKQY